MHRHKAQLERIRHHEEHNPLSPIIARAQELNTHIRNYTLVLDLTRDMPELLELNEDMQEQLDTMTDEAEQLVTIVTKVAQLTATGN